MSTRLDAAAQIRRSAFFSGLPSPLLERMAAGADTILISRGQRLWSEGDPAAHVGLVLSGRLKAVRASGQREVIVDVALPGDVLGDVAFALEEPHDASVVGLRRSRVLLLPAEALRQAFSQDPRALSHALFSLARRAQRLMRLVEGLSAGSVERRLATALSTLTERVGEPFPGGLLVPVRLRRAELAALAATSEESVSRSLAAWQRRGILTVLPEGYLVRELPALQRLATGQSAPRASRSA
ncbi:MAG: Crp/Fnr family transcriptional regulator [Anaeromyxobacteraceae bacterium]|nr:Crp/Fnr family transcriptional regulator [Anaeromyxobacteraceae bacterium]